MSAKLITSALAAVAMVASLSVATPAAALNQDQRNIVGGILLGAIGTAVVNDIRKNNQRSNRSTYVCHNPYKTYRNGKLVTVCR